MGYRQQTRWGWIRLPRQVGACKFRGQTLLSIADSLHGADPRRTASRNPSTLASVEKWPVPASGQKADANRSDYPNRSSRMPVSTVSCGSCGATSETSSSSTPRKGEIILRMVCSSWRPNTASRGNQRHDRAPAGGALPTDRPDRSLAHGAAAHHPPSRASIAPAACKIIRIRCVDALPQWIGRVRMDWFVATVRPDFRAAYALQAV